MSSVVWSVECEVGNGDCGVGSVECVGCKVKSVEKGVGIVECRVHGV